MKINYGIVFLMWITVGGIMIANTGQDISFLGVLVWAVGAIILYFRMAKGGFKD